jgi:hypothetical protein
VQTVPGGWVIFDDGAQRYFHPTSEYQCHNEYGDGGGGRAGDDGSGSAGSGSGSDPSCWDTTSCSPTGDYRHDIEREQECPNDPNAWKDHCGRCVGGSTGLDPALPGMSCTMICRYNDPFLDKMNIQAEIHRMWNASFGPNSSPLPHDQRNEAVVLVEQYLNEPLSFRVIEPTDPINVSSCHVGVRITFDRTNQRRAVQAILHTHPFSPGDTIWDQRCVDYQNSRLRPGEAPFELGRIRYNATEVSEGDENIAIQVGKPMYVVDRQAIRRINPSNPDKYERDFSHCWN